MLTRKSVIIPVQPWFKDHRFNGQCIFPAVESMLLLAEIAKELRPDIQTTFMYEAVFSKFLAIPKGATELSALVDIEEDENGLCLKLLSKIQFRKMSRIKEHAEIRFPTTGLPVTPLTQALPATNAINIEASRIYKELVPFGRTYQSLTETLYISDNTACGTLQAPTLTAQQTMEAEIGSPFPLDGAMHAACVLGQCMSDFVPFPVGFAARCIHKPTRPGEHYSTTVRAKTITQDELLCDLSIFDTAGRACETIRGLRMRDVSRGAIKPPQDLPRTGAFPQ